MIAQAAFVKGHEYFLPSKEVPGFHNKEREQ